MFSKTENIAPLSQIAKSKHSASVWRTVALSSLTLNGLAILGTIYLCYSLPKMLSKVQYVLAPGIQTMTVVRPGELPDSYIEQTFKHVISLVNGFQYVSIKDSYKMLFDNFYSKELRERVEMNLRAENYFDQVEKQKMTSIWRYKKDESQFKWCGNVKLNKHDQGVACGIVTGEQDLYANGIPVSNRKLSYLVFGVNVAPNPSTPGKNMFAVEIFRVKAGELKNLEQELENAYKNGVLPPE